MEKVQVHGYPTINVNNTFMAVVDDVGYEMVQEMANYGDKINADQWE